MLKANPCLTCGACCAFFLVSFLSGNEAAPETPADLSEPFDGSRRCMKGTNQDEPRCVALQGEIGGPVLCAIYDKRPVPCRNFGIQWKGGIAEISEEHFIHCNRARHKWKLPRLSRRRFSILPPAPAEKASKDRP
jgi:uncharacterized protein